MLINALRLRLPIRKRLLCVRWACRRVTAYRQFQDAPRCRDSCKSVAGALVWPTEAIVESLIIPYRRVGGLLGRLVRCERDVVKLAIERSFEMFEKPVMAENGHSTAGQEANVCRPLMKSVPSADFQVHMAVVSRYQLGADALEVGGFGRVRINPEDGHQVCR